MLVNDVVDRALTDEVMISDLFETLRSKGYEPSEFGLTEEVIRRRLSTAEAEAKVTAFNPAIQPQMRREALKGRLSQESRSIADTVLNRIGIRHQGKELLRYFSGSHNTEVLIRLASSEQNKIMEIEKGGRTSASADQLQTGISASADIVDKLSAVITGKIKNAENEADG